MISIRDLSIRGKLMLLAGSSSLIAVTVCCVGFVLYDITALKSNRLAKVRGQAELLAANSGAVVQFEEEDQARKLLESLRPERSIEQAILYSPQGEQVARFAKSDAPHPSTPPLREGYTWLDEGKLRVVSAVEVETEVVGYLVVWDNLVDLREQVIRYLELAGLVVLGALSTALLLAARLQQSVAGPVVQLAQVARDVTRRGNYQVCVVPPGRDELGQLYRTFNEMLSRIAESKEALQNANQDLEVRIKQRTYQLELEITERQRTEDELIRAVAAAESANKVKSQFLANMSHEIRTPMNAILGFTDLLIRGADSDEAERTEFLRTIHHSGQHLLALINDILDLSKIEADRLEVERIEANPHQQIADVISVMRVKAREKGLSLEYNWSGAVPARIQTDPARFRQMLINLVGNAIKFTESGGVRITARITEARLLEIDVEDTGIGIAPDKVDRIFDPFSQADASVTRRFGGTGLGLTICRRLAQALGGNIEVHSQVGVGSRFRLTLNPGPLSGESLTPLPPLTDLVPSPAASQQQAIALPKANVLLVEDGETNRRLIHLILSRHGVNVVDAVDGQQGIQKALTGTYDLVLMDMQMPVKDGYSATRELRAAGIQWPIVALTAHAMKGDEEKCREAGCSDYLTKPITEDALLAKLGEILYAGRPAEAAAAAKAPIRSTLPADDADFREIIAEFVIRLGQRLSSGSEMIDQARWSDLQHLAHWLRGSAGTAGFDVFTKPSAMLEEAALASDAAKSQQWLAQLLALYGRLELPRTLPAPVQMPIVPGSTTNV
jgi:two-component system, sensor histidine kinase